MVWAGWNGWLPHVASGSSIDCAVPSVSAPLDTKRPRSLPLVKISSKSLFQSQSGGSTIWYVCIRLLCRHPLLGNPSFYGVVEDGMICAYILAKKGITRKI